MSKLKTQTIFCGVLALAFSLVLFVFSFFDGIESHTFLSFFQRFLFMTLPLLLVITLISIVRLNVQD